MDEVPVSEVDPGVADFAALGFPKVEAISTLEVFQPGDRLSDERLLGCRAGKIDADFPEHLLDKPGAIDA